MNLRIALVLGALSLTACGGSGSPGQSAAPTAPAAPAPDAAAATASTKPASPVPAEPPKASRDQLIKDAIANVAKVSAELARIRALPFKREVTAEYQSQEDFRKFVKQEIEADLPAKKSEVVSRSMAHLGLLKERIDLKSALEDALVSQAGAYYDPGSKKFYIVMVPEQPMLLDTLSSHELTHALQDQHFDLLGYYGGRGNPQGLSEDTLNARRFVVEGEATLTMTAYQMHAMAKMNLLDPAAAQTARLILAQMARMDLAQITAEKKKELGLYKDVGEDIRKAMEAMDKIPPYILVPLIDSYLKGALPVYEAYARGGWAAVKKLYDDPVDSTEQVLHPAEKLVGKRDYPMTVTLPAASSLRPLKGYEQIHSDVAGELLLRVYLGTWGVAGEDAAAGWDGDRYAVFAQGDRTVALWATTWDTPADAAEFARAYRTSLKARFPGGAESGGKGWTGTARPDGTLVAVADSGRDVHIVDGAAPADAPVLLAALRKVKPKKHPKE